MNYGSPAKDLTLGETFRTRFEVAQALTDKLKDQAYRLRHRVYCEDLGFEPQRPDGRETDQFDI
jgi:N-acyl amino acid synthase of PEP-CTERM/exosortase system